MGPLQNMAFFVELPDDALLVRAQRHFAGALSPDEAAISEATRRAVVYAHRMIRAFDPENPRWEDLGQDAGMLAFKKLKKYDPEFTTRDGQPTSWFKYVAGFTYRVLKADYRKHRLRAIGEIEAKLTACTEAAAIAMLSEEAERLHAAIPELPDECRVIAELRYLRGFTQVETAEHLGLTQATVKHRSDKARALLAEALSEKGTTAEHP